MQKMTTSEHGMDFISRWEGKAPRLRSRRCLGDRFELSYGVTFHPDGRPVQEGEEITYAYHLEMFRFALGLFEKDVSQRLTIQPNQFQFDAMVALSWNIGRKGFSESSVLKFTNERRWEDAADSFGMWKYSSTKYEDDRKTRIAAPDGSISYVGADNKAHPIIWKAARRGLVRRHYGEGGMYLGRDMSFLHQQLDLVELDTRRDWHERGKYYKDAVTFQTPFSEVLALATESLPSPVYIGESSPIDANPVEAPEPKPKPEPRAKKIVKSRTLWGATILGVAATPEFENFASQIMGTGEGVLGKIMFVLGFGLVLVGRIGASGPIEVRRAES